MYNIVNHNFNKLLHTVQELYFPILPDFHVAPFNDISFSNNILWKYQNKIYRYHRAYVSLESPLRSGFSAYWILMLQIRYN